MHTIRRMASALKFEVKILHERVTQQRPLMKCAEVLVRKVQANGVAEVRMAMCGSQDAGKKHPARWTLGDLRTLPRVRC